MRHNASGITAARYDVNVFIDVNIIYVSCSGVNLSDKRRNAAVAAFKVRVCNKQILECRLFAESRTSENTEGISESRNFLPVEAGDGVSLTIKVAHKRIVPAAYHIGRHIVVRCRCSPGRRISRIEYEVGGKHERFALHFVFALFEIISVKEIREFFVLFYRAYLNNSAFVIVSVQNPGRSVSNLLIRIEYGLRQTYRIFQSSRYAYLFYDGLNSAALAVA